MSLSAKDKLKKKMLKERQRVVARAAFSLFAVLILIAVCPLLYLRVFSARTSEIVTIYDEGRYIHVRRCKVYGFAGVQGYEAGPRTEDIEAAERQTCK